MRMGPHLVFRSALLGSFLLSIFGYLATPNDLTTYFTYSPVYQEAAAAEAPTVRVAAATPNKGTKAFAAPAGCAVSPSYPEKILRWCQLITAYARSERLAPDLVAALILQESGGNALAYSHSGAVGLMQVMPRDGLAAAFQCPNGPCFASRPTIRELENPDFNVAYGTNFLAGLIERYGDIREALKAYGPRDVGYYYADKVLALWSRYGVK